MGQLNCLDPSETIISDKNKYDAYVATYARITHISFVILKVIILFVLIYKLFGPELLTSVPMILFMFLPLLDDGLTLLRNQKN